MPPAGGTLGKYVVHNFICLCFMVEGSYVIIYTQDHNSSPEWGRLRITLCRHQEDMKELLPIHHHHLLQHRIHTIIYTELHSPFECCLKLFFVICRVVWRQRRNLLGRVYKVVCTPAHDDDPSLHTPLAQLRRPARNVGPPERHSYPRSRTRTT